MCTMRYSLWCCSVALVLWSAAHSAIAGGQREEALADSVRTLLRQSISAGMPSRYSFDHTADDQRFLDWQARVQPRLSRFVAQPPLQSQLLFIIDYEARRAGLDPDWVLALIEVESRFNPRAISPANARGLMQVMPFWTRAIGDGQVRTLHDARINIRYGCVILRHYLDQEQGDLVRALARYNGSLGQLTYPAKVLNSLVQWRSGVMAQ